MIKKNKKGTWIRKPSSSILNGFTSRRFFNLYRSWKLLSVPLAYLGRVSISTIIGCSFIIARKGRRGAFSTLWVQLDRERRKWDLYPVGDDPKWIFIKRTWFYQHRTNPLFFLADWLPPLAVSTQRSVRVKSLYLLFSID